MSQGEGGPACQGRRQAGLLMDRSERPFYGQHILLLREINVAAIGLGDQTLPDRVDFGGANQECLVGSDLTLIMVGVDRFAQKLHASVTEHELSAARV